MSATNPDQLPAPDEGETSSTVVGTELGELPPVHDDFLAPAPSSAEAQLGEPRPTWPLALPRVSRGGPPVRVLVVAAGALVMLALVGLGALRLRAALTPPPAATPVASRPTPTVSLTATAIPTMPNFGVPNGKIAFGYSGDLSDSQTCIGTAALQPIQVNLDNSGDIAIDWWVDVTQTLPDGKTLWTGAAPPYNTLPAGQTAQLQLQPDPGLCGELIGHHGIVQYTAKVNYGGSGTFTVTETVTPPPPGTATPTPTLPPTPSQ